MDVLSPLSCTRDPAFFFVMVNWQKEEVRIENDLELSDYIKMKIDWKIKECNLFSKSPEVDLEHIWNTYSRNLKRLEQFLP